MLSLLSHYPKNWQNLSTGFLYTHCLTSTKIYAVLQYKLHISCLFPQRHWWPLRSDGEPGSTGTKPLPPKTGRMNASSNLRHKRWTVCVGVLSNARMLLGRWIGSISTSESWALPRSGTVADFGVDVSVAITMFISLWFGVWGSKSLMSGLVIKPNTWELSLRNVSTILKKNLYKYLTMSNLIKLSITRWKNQSFIIIESRSNG